MPRADVTVMVQLRLLPDCVEQGKLDLLDFARTVQKRERECSAIEIAQDLDDPTRITMIEKWSSRDAYMGPHLQDMRLFIDQSGKYFDGSVQIFFCQGVTIGEQSRKPAAPYGR